MGPSEYQYQNLVPANVDTSNTPGSKYTVNRNIDFILKLTHELQLGQNESILQTCVSSATYDLSVANIFNVEASITNH